MAFTGNTPFDSSSFKIDNLTSLNNKLSLFNSYMAEYSQLAYLTARNVGRSTELLDIPIQMKLMQFWPKDISGVPLLPFIVLPVNPDNFKVQYKKKTDVVYTLGGFVVNHWHDDVTTVTAEGYIPSFASKAKILTTSYQLGFLPLLNLYKSCGQVSTEYRSTIQYQSQDEGKMTTVPPKGANVDGAVNTSRLAEVKPAGIAYGENQAKTTDTLVVTGNQLRNASIQLIYQHDLYEGVFTDFTIEETYEQPNTLKYGFTFKSWRQSNVIVPNILESMSKDQITNFQSGYPKGFK